MRLADLSPRIGQPGPHGEQFLAFRCPRCRHHEISIEIWSRPHGEIERELSGEKYKVRVWRAEQGPYRDWDTLSLSPSINRDGLGDKCGGWHGHITDGEVR